MRGRKRKGTYLLEAMEEGWKERREEREKQGERQREFTDICYIIVIFRLIYCRRERERVYIIFTKCLYFRLICCRL
jgi:hypothetical protein